MYANPGLEPHEKLFLYRKRTGLSQKALVDDVRSRTSTYPVNLQKVKDWEAGAADFDPVFVLPYQPHAVSQAEWCIIERRRAGWTQEDVADKLKVQLSMVKRMEAGTAPAEELVKFWEKRQNRAQKRRHAKRAKS